MIYNIPEINNPIQVISDFLSKTAVDAEVGDEGGPSTLVVVPEWLLPSWLDNQGWKETLERTTAVVSYTDLFGDWWRGKDSENKEEAEQEQDGKVDVADPLSCRLAILQALGSWSPGEQGQRQEQQVGYQPEVKGEAAKLLLGKRLEKVEYILPTHWIRQRELAAGYGGYMLLDQNESIDPVIDEAADILAAHGLCFPEQRWQGCDLVADWGAEGEGIRRVVVLADPLERSPHNLAAITALWAELVGQRSAEMEGEGAAAGRQSLAVFIWGLDRQYIQTTAAVAPIVADLRQIRSEQAAQLDLYQLANRAILAATGFSPMQVVDVGMGCAVVQPEAVTTGQRWQWLDAEENLADYLSKALNLIAVEGRDGAAQPAAVLVVPDAKTKAECDNFLWAAGQGQAAATIAQLAIGSFTAVFCALSELLDGEFAAKGCGAGCGAGSGAEYRTKFASCLWRLYPIFSHDVAISDLLHQLKKAGEGFNCEDYLQDFAERRMVMAYLSLDPDAAGRLPRLLGTIERLRQGGTLSTVNALAVEHIAATQSVLALLRQRDFSGVNAADFEVISRHWQGLASSLLATLERSKLGHGLWLSVGYSEFASFLLMMSRDYGGVRGSDGEDGPVGSLHSGGFELVTLEEMFSLDPAALGRLQDECLVFYCDFSVARSLAYTSLTERLAGLSWVLRWNRVVLRDPAEYRRFSGFYQLHQRQSQQRLQQLAEVGVAAAATPALSTAAAMNDKLPVIKKVAERLVANPPLYMRPRFLGVSALAKLALNPYLYYVDSILRIRPWHVDLHRSQRQFGVALHAALADTVQYLRELPGDVAELAALAAAAEGPHQRAYVAALQASFSKALVGISGSQRQAEYFAAKWQGRVAKVAKGVYQREIELLGAYRIDDTVVESTFRWDVDLGDGESPVRIEVRLDRVDYVTRLADGANGLVITEYKTGATRKKDEMTRQLLLGALAAYDGDLARVTAAAQVVDLRWVQFSPGGEIREESIPLTRIEAVRDEVYQTLLHYYGGGGAAAESAVSAAEYGDGGGVEGEYVATERCEMWDRRYRLLLAETFSELDVF